MKYRNDVIRQFFFFISDLDMMLAWDNASCDVATNTLVMLVANNVQKLRWPAKSLDLNPVDPLLDLLNRKVRA